MSLTAVSPSDYSLLPGLPPPEGIVPNFINPENRANAYLGVAGVFLSLALLSVVARLYVRLRIQRSPWWDDLVIVLALLCQAAYTGLNGWLCAHGVGKHQWNVRLSEVLKIATPARIMADMTEPSIGFTKLALLLFYLRLFHPNHIIRVAIIIGLVFVFVCYTTLMFLFIFLSSTVALNNLSRAMAVFNVLSDTYILVLPIYSVMALHLPRKKRLGVSLVFASGILAVVMALVGAVYRFRFANNGVDFTWTLLDVIVINQIECCVGIMCACMPLFPAILSKTDFLTGDWLVSMRSMRSRVFRGSSSDASRSFGGSSRSTMSGKRKSRDRSDFESLPAHSAHNSIGNDDQFLATVTKIKANSQDSYRTDSDRNIKVTTQVDVGQV